MKNSIRLSALDGSNPLAFLAALGTLRLLTNSRPASLPRLSWLQDGLWQPEVTNAPCAAEDLAEFLLSCPRARAAEFVSAVGKNLTVEPVVLRAFNCSAVSDAELAGFAAAFGCEAIEGKRGEIQRTDFCFITGSGHQDFLGTAARLDELVTAERLRAALFGPWAREKGNSFRWDPDDAAEYALQWGDPSRGGASAVWAANWLAFHALPCLPTQPTSSSQLRTTAFRRVRGEDPEFRWPIWAHALSLQAVRALLASSALQGGERPDAVSLAGMGVPCVFGARRIRIGQGANFKVSFRPAVAL